MKNVYVYFPQEQFYKSVLVFMLRAFKVTLNVDTSCGFYTFSAMGAMHLTETNGEKTSFISSRSFFSIPILLCVCVRARTKSVYPFIRSQ